MPYDSISELPDNVRDNLPEHAQEIFLEGASFTLLIHQLWPMGVIGIVSLAAAAWLFRHRLY